MIFVWKIFLNIILFTNISLPCLAIFVDNLNSQGNAWTEIKKTSFQDDLVIFDQTKKNFEKKLTILNILWEQEIYQEVMIAVNHLYERWQWLVSRFPVAEMFENFDDLTFQRISDLEWMANQIVYWDTKLRDSSDNNDELLNNFFNFQDRANVLDTNIDYQINNLKLINWKDEAEVYQFLNDNWTNLKNMTEDYNLLNRELIEWEGSSNYNNYLYSLAKYRKFKKISDLITIKIKNNFHYFIKLIIESINQESKNLINKITYIKNQKNLSHEYLLLLNKWSLIKQYKDYLIHEELQENLLNQFTEFNYLASQVESLFQENYPNLLQDFVTNLTNLKQNLIKKQEKITLYGIWEEIVGLYKIFKDYKNDYQLIKKNPSNYSFHFKLLFTSQIEKLIEDIEQIFKTIHYQGINSVQDDPNDESLLIKYMTDEAFIKMANGYMSEKNLISVVTSSLGGAVITSVFSFMGAVAGGFLGSIVGAIVGVAVSYGFSQFVNHLVDLIYGEWNQLLNNFRGISKGAGVIFKVPKNHTVPQNIIIVIQDTIKPQEPKFLI